MSSPKINEWWMCVAESGRTCPMFRCKDGWGCIREKSGRVDKDFVRPYDSLKPLYKMVEDKT